MQTTPGFDDLIIENLDGSPSDGENPTPWCYSLPVDVAR